MATDTAMSRPALDDLDRRLLDTLQRQVPLVARPFAELGSPLKLTEAEVIERLARLRGPGGIIRQISAIFDSKQLGYLSSLVAARVDEDRIDEAVAIINTHPGVSHNYRRDHIYNLWYTIAVPPDSRLGLAASVDLLHKLSGARVTRLMPTLKMYKIGVRFDLSGESAPEARGEGGGGAADQAEAPPPLTDADRRMIRALQQDLPLVPRPYDVWAEQAQASVDELLVAALDYLERGMMRRMAAVLHHRHAGFGANAMGAWVVPADQHDQFGQIAAGFDAVSHCYLRPTFEDWPYALFTMVHGRERGDCEQTLAAISAATGIKDYTALYSTHEYKKVRVRYMTDDINQWEQQHARQVTPSRA